MTLVKDNDMDNKEISAFLPTKYGDFRIHVFKMDDSEDIVMLQHGELQTENTLMRMHSECLTGDVFGSLKCDCQEQLHKALKAIVDNGSGLLFYLRQEGRGIGIFNKICAYNLQDKGENTIDANLHLGLPVDARTYDGVISILHHLNVKSVRLITNNPLKIEAFDNSGIAINEVVKIDSTFGEFNSYYLNTKKSLMNHML